MTSPGSWVIRFAPVWAAALLGGCTGQIGDSLGQPVVSGAGGTTAIGGGTGGVGSTPPGGATATGGSTGTTGTGGSSGSVTVASDLPCDVATLLNSKCIACHGAKPAGGAPMSLTDYAQMTAPAISDPSKTMAAVALSRMMTTAAPMPPVGYPAASSAEVAALQNWISAGYPMTGCSSVPTTTVDAGAPPPDPFAVAPTCTSGKTWSGSTEGSASMQPGVACINCHNSSGGEAPRFTIAGTLYPTAHEPNQCDGVNGSTNGAKVVITDANQNVITLTPNSAGNFYYTGTVATPFHAKVTDTNGERDMLAGQTSGDCNACHTQNGTMSAPGRIILP
jgi:hypothetical protein